MLIPYAEDADVPPNIEHNRCKEIGGPMNKASLCEAIQGDINIVSPCHAHLTCIRITCTDCSEITCNYTLKKTLKK